MHVVLHNHFNTGRAARVNARVQSRRLTRDRAPYIGDDGKEHTYINDDPKQGPCGCGHYKAVDSKPQEYLARVDAHLKTLPSSEAKKKFLRAQLIAFENRFNDFQERARRNGKIGPNETAWAYSETLGGLSKRLSSL